MSTVRKADCCGNCERQLAYYYKPKGYVNCPIQKTVMADSLTCDEFKMEIENK